MSRRQLKKKEEPPNEVPRKVGKKKNTPAKEQILSQAVKLKKQKRGEGEGLGESNKCSKKRRGDGEEWNRMRGKV